METAPRSHRGLAGLPERSIRPGRESLLSPPAATALSDVLFVFLTQMHQGRGRLGEEDSDVDIEGYDEEDGKPKTPAPVSMFTESLWLLMLWHGRSPTVQGRPSPRAAAEGLRL